MAISLSWATHMLDNAVGSQQVLHRSSPSPAGGVLHVDVKISGDK